VQVPLTDLDGVQPRIVEQPVVAQVDDVGLPELDAGQPLDGLPEVDLRLGVVDSPGTPPEPPEAEIEAGVGVLQAREVELSIRRVPRRLPAHGGDHHDGGRGQSGPREARVDPRLDHRVPQSVPVPYGQGWHATAAEASLAGPRHQQKACRADLAYDNASENAGADRSKP